MTNDFYFSVLDYVFHVYPIHKDVVKWFRDFLTDPVENAIEIHITKEMVVHEEQQIEEQLFNPGLQHEKTAIHRIVSDYLLKEKVFLFHGSALVKDGYCFMFTGKSGAGKSTHSKLWRELYKEKITMINDDKPYLRLENGQIMVYGSPWNGKHHLGTNNKAPLKAIGLIHQADKNECIPISGVDAFLPVFSQIYRPEDPVDLMNTMDFVRTMIDLAEVYDVYCTKDIEAAKTSHDIMNMTH